jgi:hypothetical protein
MKKLLVLSMVLLSFSSCTKDDVLSPNTESSSSGVKRTTSIQCSGTTQAGSRCKNKTLSSNGRCYLHGGN